MAGGMITVTRAGPSDVVAILGLRKRLYTESAAAAGNGHVDSTQEWRAMHDILGMLLDPFVVVLLAKDGDKPVGMIAVATGGLISFYKEPCVTITWIYVDPAYRDGQVLLPLIRAAEQAIVPDRPLTVQATIRFDNTAMMDAATRLGYTPIAQIVERHHGRVSRPTAGQEIHQERSQDATGGARRTPARSELPTRT